MWARTFHSSSIGIALGNAAYEVLASIILGKIKPYIKKIPLTIRMDSEMEAL